MSRRHRRPGPKRYGEHHDPKVLKRELKLMRRLRELRAEMGWDLAAEKLNAEGYSTRKGTVWTGAGLHSVFRYRRLPKS